MEEEVNFALQTIAVVILCSMNIYQGYKFKQAINICKQVDKPTCIKVLENK